MGHWPSGRQVFALQVIPFSFWWLLSVKASSIWIFHSRVQGRLFSYLRKFPYFSHFMTHYNDLAFKNKTFCFLLNLSGEKVWNHIAQMHKHVQIGTQLGEFSCTTPNEGVTAKSQTAGHRGVCKFFLLAGEFQSWDQDISTHWLFKHLRLPDSRLPISIWNFQQQKWLDVIVWGSNIRKLNTD